MMLPSVKLLRCGDLNCAELDNYYTSECDTSLVSGCTILKGAQLQQLGNSEIPQKRVSSSSRATAGFQQVPLVNGDFEESPYNPVNGWWCDSTISFSGSNAEAVTATVFTAPAHGLRYLQMITSVSGGQKISCSSNVALMSGTSQRVGKRGTAAKKDNINNNNIWGGYGEQQQEAGIVIPNTCNLRLTGSYKYVSNTPISHTMPWFYASSETPINSHQFTFLFSNQKEIVATFFIADSSTSISDTGEWISFNSTVSIQRSNLGFTNSDSEYPGQLQVVLYGGNGGVLAVDDLSLSLNWSI